ncbi:DUF4476 domain-containing protein [Pyxidicoccus sp. MSG2]|uniref:DUF4476 domain-containing protein n=1 Tax=Pyxidicoccus sp. MSG2 TaxID=2996790 RepID=UPI0022701B13|nr:DUF4476 domain-containing protein [Pyxidicoccus sp. MSG2]MCY1022499.1 DUF4476 domain-containing protein [Pyxidicoccus sp. MSG2]
MKAWILAATLAYGAPSLAQGFASKQVSHQWSTKSDVSASVNVTAPEGATGEISRGGKVVFRAEIPFRWEPRDLGPYQFTITSSSGETWSKELNIESMKAHQLRVQLTSSSSARGGGAAPAPAASAPAPTDAPPTANVAIGPETFTWAVSSDVTCTVKVLEPEGATGEIWAGNRLVKRLEIPFLYSPNDVGFYKFVVRTADGKVWVKKLEVEGMKMHKLTVKALGSAPAVPQESAPRAEAPAPAPAPQAEAPAPSPGHVPGAVSDEDFEQLTEVINDEAMSDDKLRVVEMASRRGRFSVYQVGQLVDLFSMSGDKVNVVKLLRASIADRKNAYQLMSKFTFSSDKEQVQKLLAGN